MDCLRPFSCVVYRFVHSLAFLIDIRLIWFVPSINILYYNYYRKTYCSRDILLSQRHWVVRSVSSERAYNCYSTIFNNIFNIIIYDWNFCSLTEWAGVSKGQHHMRCLFFQKFRLHWSKLKSNFRRSLRRPFKRIHYVRAVEVDKHWWYIQSDSLILSEYTPNTYKQHRYILQKMRFNDFESNIISVAGCYLILYSIAFR